MIVSGSGEANPTNLVNVLFATSQNTSGSAYLMYSFGTSNSIWAPERAGVLYGISASFVNTVNASTTVYFQAYMAGSAVGPATPSRAMTTTRQFVNASGGAYAFGANAQIEIAAYVSGSPGGTLLAQAHLTVLYT